MSARVRIDSCGRQPIDPIPAGFFDDQPPTTTSKPPTRYVELTARSTYSFLRGASSPEELVNTAADLGHDTLAVTDCDGIYGVVRAHEAARKKGIHLIIGCELTICASASVTRDQAGFSSIVLLVENLVGYGNLCRILTESHRRHPKGAGRKKHEGLPRNVYANVPVDVVCAHAAGISPIILSTMHHDEASIAQVHRAFGARASLAVHRHLDGDDEARIRRAIAWSERFGIPICATNAVRYARAQDKPLFDVLHCIREGTTLDDAGRALTPNTEARLKSEAQMTRIFERFPAWIDQTRAIASRCTFSLKELKYRFPSELTDRASDDETADQALRRLTYEGAESRYDGAVPEPVRAQIEKELALIAKIGVAPYFLSVREIIEMARSRNILCQGRGSAANSAVCFCLRITAVDPTKSNLLFERFLSAERAEPPDIDVDFEHERREEVIQAIYARYGRDRAAMVSEVICYRGKSALREVAKVFGFSLEQVDRLAQVTTWWDTIADVNTQRLAMAGFDPRDRRVRMVIAMAAKIQGVPRHLSIHVGGFILSAAPLNEVAPIEPATMKDRTVIPWDKDDLDALGFFKVDVLALGMLTAIRKALDLSKHDPAVDADNAIDQLAKIPAEDPAVYEALCHADTVGVFQIESRAQMAMLPRLQPRKFYDLVVEVAIVRPGPIQGGMIHPYLRRRSGEEPIDSPHALLNPILDRTLGVPIFQEQVMEIAIVGAGYTGGEADQLRRDMAAWKKNGNLARHEERLRQGFAARGISREFADRLYSQIKGFAEYGFPESHASSFALLVYASSWLKLHHATEFAVALVNSQPMGFYSPSTILQDAQRHGVKVLPITIDRSDRDCTIEIDDEGNRAMRIGLRQIRGLSKKGAERVEKARKVRAFTDLEDLSARAELDRRDLDALATSGALDTLVGGRREALWAVRAPRAEGLFSGIATNEERPPLPKMSRADQLLLDFGTTGLSVDDHPMKILRPNLPKTTRTSVDMATLAHGSRHSVAGLVLSRQRPQTASGVVFITLEDEHGFINLILYSRVFEQFRLAATTSKLLRANGKIERAGEVVYLVVERLERIDQGKLPGMSRDFH